MPTDKAAKKTDETPQEGFWSHVAALRSVVIKIVVLVCVVCVGTFCAMPWIFDNVIMAPCRGDFVTYRVMDGIARAVAGVDAVAPDFSADIMSLELTSQMFVHLSASFWVAAMLVFPVVIYLLWTFVAPGLYDHEKRGARRGFLAANLLFYLGVAVGYFMVFPLALRFLADYRLSDTIRAVVSLDSYMDNFFLMLIMMGAVFQLPVVSWLLGRIGVLNRGIFHRYRRHAIVILLIVAALITPTGDPFTLFLVFVPIYALYELSAWLVPADERPDNKSETDEN